MKIPSLIKISLSGLCLVASLSFTLSAHPGRLDSNGGHHDRKSGGYHYHRSTTARTPVASTPASTTTSAPTAITPAKTPANPIPTTAEVYFSPNGGCTDAIVREISAAKKSVHVMAYSFTSAPIAKALTDAHKRGVAVHPILDKSNQSATYSSATFLHNAGIAVMIDAKHAIQHNKVIIIDGITVITGSFNFSKAAEENNAENLLVLRCAELAKKYLENWQAHQMHAELYMGR